MAHKIPNACIEQALKMVESRLETGGHTRTCIINDQEISVLVDLATPGSVYRLQAVYVPAQGLLDRAAYILIEEGTASECPIVYRAASTCLVPADDTD